MSDDFSIPNTGYRGDRTGRYGIGHGRRRRRMDPATRRLAMFAGGIGVVLAALIGASAMIGHTSTGIPVIAADSGPVRIRPGNPGGMKIDGAENDVFSGGSDTANARLAPPAETPNTAALRAEAPSPPVVAPPAAPASASPAATVPPSPAPAAAKSPPPPVARTPVVAHAVAKPAAADHAGPRTASVEAHPAAAGHQPIVQLAALTSEEAAHKEWQRLSKRMPDLLNDRQPSFSRTEYHGRTYWRVRTTGFADAAQARAFCGHVRAKGGGCSVADF